jgi:hypothetical protein
MAGLVAAELFLTGDRERHGLAVLFVRAGAAPATLF